MERTAKIERRVSRQIAFLMIYSSDMGKTTYPEVLDYFLNDDNLNDLLDSAAIVERFPELEGKSLSDLLDEDERFYIVDTVSGTMDNLQEIDALINTQAKRARWSTERMVSADKNILRLGTFELFYAPQKADPAVVIDEAVSLAHIYGDGRSYQFINAVLDAEVKQNNDDKSSESGEAGDHPGLETK